jgi:hypothetical protein
MGFSNEEGDLIMLLELELTRAKATLEGFNARTEKCGPDKVPAITMKIATPQSGDVLAFFDPTLRSFLFEEANDLAGPTWKLRHPHLEYPLSFDNEMSGATVKIAYGIDRPMEFADCDLDDFKVTPIEGGSVELVFKVHNRALALQVAALYAMQEQAIEISVEPIKQADIEKPAKRAKRSLGTPE